MTTDPDEIIRRAEEEAARKVELAHAEADIRKLLAAEFPDVPQPHSVFFPNRKDYRAEVWLSWEFPTHEERGKYGADAPTRGSYFKRARRILEAFDWQTLAYINGPTFTKIQPEDAPRSDDEDDNTMVFDGCRVNLESGERFGPYFEAVAWTELPGCLNLGDVKIRVRLEDTAYPLAERPHVQKIVMGHGSERWTEKRKEYPRIEEAFRTVKWAGAGDDHVLASYLFSTKLWTKFADKAQAELGD